jgi:tetratricopeptide (TPR) repeat protein
MEDESFQLADLYVRQAEQLQPGNPEHYDLLGYIHFSMENYEESKTWNERALEINPLNAYAYKGLGLCLVRLENKNEGIAMLEKTIECAPVDFTDPYYDLAVVYIEDNEIPRAMEVLEQGFLVSDSFRTEHGELYNALKQREPDYRLI